MKVRTEGDIDRLDHKIQSDLGIDLKRYTNPEAAARFVEMLLFPAYAIFWFTIPMSCFLLVFIAGYWMPSFTLYDIIGYSTFCLVFMLMTSVSFSLLFLLFKTKTDIVAILNYSLEVTQHVLRDAEHLDGRVSLDERSNVRKLLFHGVVHLVTIPMVTKVFAEKIPLFGDVFSSLIKKLLRLMTTRVNIDDTIQLNEKHNNKATFTEDFINRIEKVKMSLKVIFWSAFSIVAIPLGIFFLICATGVLLTVWLLI